MVKKIIIISLILLTLIFMNYSKSQKKSSLIDCENVDVILACNWPAEEFQIIKTDDINNIMDCIKNINSFKKIPSFDLENSFLGGPQRLVIVHDEGVVNIYLNNNKLEIFDTINYIKEYYEISQEDRYILYNKVVAYRKSTQNGNPIEFM